MSTPESDVLAPPNNPATALFNILKVVVLDNPDSAVMETWSRTLDAQLATPDFVRKHTEVVRLMDSVIVVLNGDAELSESFLEYVPQWYDAVVCRSGWQDRGSNMVSADALKQLRSLGMTIGRTSPRVWDDESRARLEDAFEKWSLVLNTELPPDLAQDIRARLVHLRWLMDNVGTFGVGPITNTVSGLVASGSQAMTRSTASVKVKIGAAIGAVFVFLGQSHQAVDDVAGILEGTNQIVREIEQLAEPQKALPPGHPQIEAGSSGDSASDTSAATDG